jgi:galactonate dehydratase
MRIARIEDLHADGGLRTLSFLKVTTECGQVGWSEFSEFVGTHGLAALIRRIGASLVGEDPRASGRLAATLAARSRTAAGGLNAQACAAIENACLDLKARALGVPVHALLGGAIRERLRVYASHVGTYRLRAAELLGVAPIRSVEDFRALGEQVAALGVAALKTNLVLFDGPAPALYMPSFGTGRGHPERDLPTDLVDAAVAQLAALREGAGPTVRLMLDVVSNFRADGCIRLGRALERFDLEWLEADLPDARSLAQVRRAVPMPVASLESVYGRRGVLPFLEAGAVDVAIVDPMWNGVVEAMKIADLADTFDVAVSSHAYTGPLALAMCAHLCAAIPNCRFVEMDFDRPAWIDALFDAPLVVEHGWLRVPEGPGWGIAPNEAALRARPPRAPVG